MDLLSTLSTAMNVPWVVEGIGLGILSGHSNLVKLSYYFVKTFLGLDEHREFQLEPPR